jgi:hypothetical protein
MSRENVQRVRDAIFEAADGITLDEAMQGIIMAQAKLVAHTVGDDVQAAHDVLDRYRQMQTEAMPIYCAETVSAKQ